MYCNRCQVPQQPSSQCLSTSCLHLFCIKCAKDVFDAGYECPVCGTSLTRSSIKLVKILSDNTEELSLALAGQAPEVACQASETAVRFYVEQVNLASQVKDRSHKKKIEKIQLAARQKLGEFSQATQLARQKYHEVSEQKEQLSQDLREIQDKYSQKAQQAQNLSDQVAHAKRENQELRAALSHHQQQQQQRHLRTPQQQPQQQRGPSSSSQGLMTPLSGQLVPFQQPPLRLGAPQSSGLPQQPQGGGISRRKSVSPRDQLTSFSPTMPPTPVDQLQGHHHHHGAWGANNSGSSSQRHRTASGSGGGGTGLLQNIFPSPDDNTGSRRQQQQQQQLRSSDPMSLLSDGPLHHGSPGRLQRQRFSTSGSSRQQQLDLIGGGGSGGGRLQGSKPAPLPGFPSSPSNIASI